MRLYLASRVKIALILEDNEMNWGSVFCLFIAPVD
jgi:hypothetical protein